MTAKDFLEKYGINTDEIIYSSDDEAHRLVDLMNGFIKELTELKKLRVADVVGRSEQLIEFARFIQKNKNAGIDYDCVEREVKDFLNQ